MRSLPAYLPVAWTVSAAAAAVVLTDPGRLVGSAFCLAVVIVLRTRSLQAALRAIRWTLPFAPPLFIVHGILNPSFQATTRILAQIPIRADGFVHAEVVSLRLLLLTIAAASWRHVEREVLFEDCVRARMPIRLVVIVAVAASTLDLLARRIEAVYLAQQARGIPSGPSLWLRVRALPSIVLPVVTSTLLEGSARGEIMENRGLGTTAFGLPSLPFPLYWGDLLAAAAFLPVLVVFLVLA